MIAGVCVLVLMTIILGTMLNQPPWNALLLPMTFTAMVLTMAYNPQFALMMTFSLELALDGRDRHGCRTHPDSHGGHGHGDPVAAARASRHRTRAGGGPGGIGVLRDDHRDRDAVGPDLGAHAQRCVSRA